MVSFILVLDLIILWACSFLLIVTAVKFLKSLDLRDRMVGYGLVCIAVALVLGSLFNIYNLFQSSYWLVVEVLHLVGAVLITLGIVGFKLGVKNKK